jgi:class 3 adenylate cyclase/tetratricopeptide (TPR) repeat protein
MECPFCQAINPDNARYCDNCKREFPLKCTNCGASLQPEARFCHICGYPVSDTAKNPTTPVRGSPEKVYPPAGSILKVRQDIPEDILQRYVPKEFLNKLEAARKSQMMVGERRIVTILFCDVKGSTEAASKLDPEEWAEIINGAFEYMIQPVYRYEGTVARLMGDGFLAFFGAPIAHEDDPQRAILAGLDILQAIQRYDRDIKSRWGIDFDVRVGINTGLVVVGAVGSDLRMEYTALGDAINIAARMEQTAKPGSVQIAEATYKHVEPLFEVELVEGLQVKEHEELRVYRVLEQKEEPGRLRGIAGLASPLIGRQREMEILGAGLEEAIQGSGGLFFLIGEAGLGKSRLVEEFRHKIFASWDQKISWLQGQSFSYDSAIPFALFSNLFADFFQIKGMGSDSLRYETIVNRLEHLVPGQSDGMAPYFAGMLGIDLEDEPRERIRYLEPVRLRGVIFDKVKKLVESILSSGPAILFLDDLHWADPTSLELLETLMPLTKDRPLMVIAAFRPQEKDFSWQFYETIERSYNGRYRKIVLHALEDSQARNMISRLLEIEALPESARQMILEKVEGNPLYIEEVLRTLMEQGLIIKKNGHWQSSKEIQTIALPDTLAALITARLDRLDETSRYVLQAAAVVGREFTLPILVGVLDIPEQIEATLFELNRWDLVREMDHPDGPAYMFKHVLIQEAAYGSILLSNRRELHRRIGEFLIRTNPGASAEIARHLVEARQNSVAVPYLVQAGERAAKAYAIKEAQAYFEQAIDLLQDQGSKDVLRRAYEGLGGIYQFSNRFPEALQTYQKMLSLAESSGNFPMQISALNKLAGVMAMGLGNFTEAERLLDKAEQLSREGGDLSSIPETSLLRCQICTVRADFDQVVVYMDEVIKIGQELDKPEEVLLGLEHVSASLLLLTRFDEALVKAEEALKISREVNDKAHEANLLAFPLPMCYLRNGDFARARQCLEEALIIAGKIELLSAQSEAGYLMTEIARWQGEYEKALAYGKKTLTAILPIEEYMPFEVVPVLGSLGMVYLEISEEFRDSIGEFHNHALRLLESPHGKLGGGTAWADLALCALQLKDLEIAEEAIQFGLNYPNIYIRLERPRLLVAAALLALTKGDAHEAVRQAQEAVTYAEERSMLYLYPFLYLIYGKMLVARADPARRDLEAGMEKLAHSEKHAQELGLKPVTWQAKAAMASALASSGKMEQVEQKLDEAKAVVLDIAGQFEDAHLRQAYERSTSAKLNRSHSMG